MFRPAGFAALGLALIACPPVYETPARLDRVGVIEGFYGRPWSHRDRLDVFRFMGRVGLNLYVYAPKDDPWHRERWREAYPDSTLRRLAELVDSAAAHGVEFWFAISPGGSMVYADTADYRLLLAKIDQVRRLGIARFGLFLDDVPTTLSHAADRAAYGSLAAAHADLANRLANDLASRGAELVVTPTTYTHAWGDRGYLEELGRLADSTIPFFWTGVDVAAPTISAADAAGWGALIGRRPWVWDNYPVNDYARWRLFLGPVTGRSADLAGAIGALAANPMNEAHASMIALHTLAQYARDPGGYDPDRALAAALDELYGPEAAAALHPVVAAFRDYGWEPNVFEPLYVLRDTIALAAIQHTLADLAAGVEGLKEVRSAGSEPLEPLIAEVAPFAEALVRRAAQLERMETYRRVGDLLVYRSELDRAPAGAGAAVVDGRVDEWRPEEWRALHRAAGAGGTARIAFRRAGDTLYVALTVPDGTDDARPGHRVGEGDHVQIVVEGTPRDEPYGLTANELVAVIAPAAGELAHAFVGSLGFTGFMTKWLADNERLTMSEFLISSFGASGPDGAVRYATRRSGAGYTVEAALSVAAGPARVSVQVTDANPRARTVWSLARRAYPGNPAVYAVIP